MNREEIIQHVYRSKIIAIIRGMEPEYCVRLTQALYDGGIDMVEVTFNQKDTGEYKATIEAISAIVAEFGERICVGAGTVLSTSQVDLAYEAGARYIVTPSTDEDVIKYAGGKKGMVTMPGALTATEAVKAYGAGADFVKIFPVGNLGAGYFKALKAPLSHIPMLAVGGVNENNINDFIKAGAVGAGVGGNLVNSTWVRNGEYNKITEVARKMVENASL